MFKLVFIERLVSSECLRSLFFGSLYLRTFKNQVVWVLRWDVPKSRLVPCGIALAMPRLRRMKPGDAAEADFEFYNQ